MEASGSENVGVLAEVIVKPTRTPYKKNWVFTLNNYKESDIEKLYKSLEAKCKTFVFGIEVGEEGTPHLQGQASFIKNIRAVDAYKGWGIHWDLQKGTLKQAQDYCKKDGNFWQFPVPKGLSSLIKQLRPWQSELAYRILQEPINDREILWIVDPVGNSGKSAFCKYMYYYYDVTVITVTKSADIALCARDNCGIYLLDFSRSMGEFCPWQGIENLKNGFIQDAKLKKEMRTVCIDPPVVVCFSNSYPDLSKLSADRWNVITLSPNQGPT